MSDGYIGLIGVVVGASLTAIKDLIASYFRKRQHANYLAVQVVCALDNFIDKCFEIIQDDGTVEGRPAGRLEYGNGYYDEIHEAQISLPIGINYPADVDWKSINPKLMYRILMLPNDITNTNQTIFSCGEHSFPPGFEEIFTARHEGYAKLGLDAIDIVNNLRDKYQLPKREYRFYNPAKEFKKVKLRIEQARNGQIATSEAEE